MKPLIILLLTAHAVFASTRAETNLNTFVKTLESGAIQKAVDGLFANNPPKIDTKDQSTKIYQYLTQKTSGLGDLKDVEITNTISCGDALTGYRLALRYEMKPIFLIITYYDNTDSAFVRQIKVVTDAEKRLSEALSSMNELRAEAVKPTPAADSKAKGKKDAKLESEEHSR